MIQAINPDAITAKRNKALLLTAFNTGLRGIDIVKMKLRDIDWKKGEIRIVQSKTQNPLTLPINGTVMNAIADYILRERPDCSSSEVFIRAVSPHVPLKGTSALDGIVESLCRKAGVGKKPYRSFHSIRRAFATELSMAEVPLTSVSQMLGHQSIDSDRPYLSFNRRQTSFCATGFCEIPLNRGIYASSKQGEFDNGSIGRIKVTECPSLSRLLPMGFSAVPLRGGVFS
jgi:integrase